MSDFVTCDLCNAPKGDRGLRAGNRLCAEAGFNVVRADKA